jgi:NADPH:quinone reductase-like Zn-dependent oxidoreductase
MNRKLEWGPIPPAIEEEPMQAVVIHETGDPEVLRLEEADRPEPDDGEVLIRVRAASVNPVDWKYRRGFVPTELPVVLGQDVSGTVEISHAAGFAVGDDVFGFASSGGYAEFATAQAAAIARKPAGVSHEQAAAIPVAGLTAWQALFDRGGLERGQTALIAGAAGGVGHFAVQFAKYAGARVIGTGSSRNREFVLGLGASEYIDYTQQDVGEAVSGVDVALDTVGGDTTGSLLPAVREGGILVTIAAAPPEEAASERGVRAELLITSPSPEQMARIAELVAAGDVVVEIADVVPLAEVPRAHELSESGHTRGKIIVAVGT